MKRRFAVVIVAVTIVRQGRADLRDAPEGVGRGLAIEAVAVSLSDRARRVVVAKAAEQGSVLPDRAQAAQGVDLGHHLHLRGG